MIRVRLTDAGASGLVPFWPVLWAAVAAAGFVALIPFLFDGGGGLPEYFVVLRLSGVSFAAWGLVAWRRRPDSAIGPMLTLTGFGVLLNPVLSQIHAALAITIGQWLGEAWIVLFTMLLLTFVTGGRLVSTVDRVVIGVFFVDLVVVTFGRQLFLDAPGNLLLVRPDAGLATGFEDTRLALGSALSLATTAVILARWWRASPPLRRALLPSLGGALCGLLYAAVLASFLARSPNDLLIWLLDAALVTVPAALAWGLLRSRLARGELAGRLRELSSLRGEPLERGLARVLGDPGLVLAQRVPGSAAYADPRGAAVAVPAPGDGRAAAPVERAGRELGLLVYDASLDDDPDLVSAVAATAAIALDDARMQAEAQARVAELRASRERIVAAGDAERRRLERNLHDGAQQRIVSVALQLRLLQGRLAADPAAAEQLKSAGEELGRSLQELRELARGIHPAVLDHGLEAALKSLATRAVVPTTVAYDGPPRLPEPVELAAYFVACEALANVGKYAHAARAAVTVSHRDGVARIEIADDGIGGADEDAGTGLVGLADRVAALDGTLRIFSPPGEGTVVTAELPCGS